MRRKSFLKRVLMAAIGGLGLALGLTFPAESLTPDEAGRVAALLVDLGPELGPFAYDGEEAGRIFEEDEAYGARIAAAGFSRESWTNAFDELFRGYLATIPNDAFSERLTQALAGLEAMSHLTEEQRAELMPLFEEKIAEIQLLRAEGARHADVVRPHAAILETVFGTDLVPAE